MKKIFNYYEKYGILVSIGTQETYEALSQFLFMENNEELLEYLKNNNVIINDAKKYVLKNINFIDAIFWSN